MTDEATFYRTICESPDDILLRLAFADWLEERGEPRAEFIRVQCELADQNTPSQSLLDREAELWDEHRSEWNGQLHRFLAANWLPNLVGHRRKPIRGWNYRCGFPEELIVEMDFLLEHHKVLLQLGPIRSLILLHISTYHQIQSFQELAILDQLRELELKFDPGGFDLSTMHSFLKDPRVRDLKLLTGVMQRPYQPTEFLMELAKNPGLSIVEENVNSAQLTFQRGLHSQGERLESYLATKIRPVNRRHELGEILKFVLGTAVLGILGAILWNLLDR